MEQSVNNSNTIAFMFRINDFVNSLIKQIWISDSQFKIIFRSIPIGNDFVIYYELQSKWNRINVSDKF